MAPRDCLGSARVRVSCSRAAGGRPLTREELGAAWDYVARLPDVIEEQIRRNEAS